MISNVTRDTGRGTMFGLGFGQCRVPERTTGLGYPPSALDITALGLVDTAPTYMPDHPPIDLPVRHIAKPGPSVTTSIRVLSHPTGKDMTAE